MKASVITGRGTQPAVQDLPTPEPAAGEILIEAEATSVNGFDLSVAAGYVWDMIPGTEFSVVTSSAPSPPWVSTLTGFASAVEIVHGAAHLDQSAGVEELRRPKASPRRSARAGSMGGGACGAAGRTA